MMSRSAPCPRLRRLLLPVALLGLLVGHLTFLPITPLSAQDEEDVSFESLYFKANDQMKSGNFQGARESFEKIFDLIGEFAWEDYGPAFGGVYYDYGSTMMQLKEWDAAREAFETSVNAKELAKKAGSAVESENRREKLSLFQWGYCEQMLGKPEEALKLYQRYINSKPDKEEVAAIRNAFTLRMGTAYVQAGKIEEGSAELTKLFDNRAAWGVKPQFLVQAIFELGQGWVLLVQNDPDKAPIVSAQAHAFLNKNQEALEMRPFDKQRYGFIARMTKIGYDAGNAGMNTLALRLFSMIPPTSEIVADLKRMAQNFSPNVPTALVEAIAEQEAQMKGPNPTQVQTQRLLAKSYERLGNRLAPRVIYSNLAEQYPDVESRGEILHEAARFATLVGDYGSAQYYGEKFMEEMPEDHELRANVSTFMLQSLFTARKYDSVLDIAGQIRARSQPGDPERELADHLYGAALYFSGRHAEAMEELDLFATHYPESDNIESGLYYQASNNVILGNYDAAASQLDAFLEKYPTSRFLDLALYDRAMAHYNKDQYEAAIEKCRKLQEARPESVVLDRSFNLAGDCYDIMSQEAEDEQVTAQYADAAYQMFTNGFKAAKERENKELASEALAKACDLMIRKEDWETAVALYDQFFPSYEGTIWEPQIYVYAMEALEAVNRGNDGLVQLEKMINQLGNAAPEEQDVELLRRAIGSYSEASERIRGSEETIAVFDNFPNLNADNQALLTWLKIQKVIVLQNVRDTHKPDTEEYAATKKRMDAVFEELRLFDLTSLSDFALQQVGLYLSRTPNRFLAVPYFEELLNRDAPDFKSPAEFEIAKIESESKDAAVLNTAKERFKRVINVYQDAERIPESHLYLGRIALATEQWAEAEENYRTINQNKKWLDQARRAESNFGLGYAKEMLGDLDNAIRAYNVVIAVYGGYAEWSGQALERGFNLSYGQAKERETKIQAYKFLKKVIYQFQKLDESKDISGALARMRRRVQEVRVELNITVEEEAAINAELGLPAEGAETAEN